MKIIALYNIKGGVGKTAASVNLAYLAARDGYETLLFDLDPQGSSTFYFRIRPRKGLKAKKLLSGDEELFKHIRATDYPRLELLPSNLSFRKMDLYLDSQKKSKKFFKSLFQPLRSEYDLLFIDCPPNINLEVENVFYLADLVLVPLIPSWLSFRSLDIIVDFFTDKSMDHSTLRSFFSMVDRRKKVHKDFLTQSHTMVTALESVIPYSSLVERMGEKRAPLCATDRQSEVSQAFENLWGECRSALQLADRGPENLG